VLSSPSNTIGKQTERDLVELIKQDVAALIHERADAIKWKLDSYAKPCRHGSLPTRNQLLASKNSVLAHSVVKEKVNGKWSPKLNSAKSLVELLM